jgi:hypothetical protein
MSTGLYYWLRLIVSEGGCDASTGLRHTAPAPQKISLGEAARRFYFDPHTG